MGNTESVAVQQLQGIPLPPPQPRQRMPSQPRDRAVQQQPPRNRNTRKIKPEEAEMDIQYVMPESVSNMQRPIQQTIDRIDSHSTFINRGSRDSIAARNMQLPQQQPPQITKQPAEFRIDPYQTVSERGNNRNATGARQERIAFDPAIRIKAPLAENTRVPTALDDDAEFEHLGFNPYKILCVTRDTDFETIRSSYKSLLRRHHPDKGGDAVYADMIIAAFKYLEKENEETEIAKQMQPVTRREYDSNPEAFKNMVNVQLGKKCSQEKFNEVFEATRLDNPLARGYGHLMVESAASKLNNGQLVTPSAASSAISSVSFGANDPVEFDDETEYGIIEYQEPRAYSTATTSLGYVDLAGENEVQDFTHGAVFGSAYTDYKRAFHRKSHIDTIPEGQEINGRANTVQRLKAERDNISFELSPEEKHRQYQIEQQRLQQDEDRQIRYQARRRLEDEHFLSTHARLLDDGSSSTAQPKRRRNQAKTLQIQN